MNYQQSLGFQTLFAFLVFSQFLQNNFSLFKFYYIELINENTDLDDNLGQVIFPKGFEVRDLENLRYEFEKLANRYGLTLPAKLKKGNLVLEWKPLPGELNNEKKKNFEKSKLRSKFSNLTIEELNAFSNCFSNNQKN